MNNPWVKELISPEDPNPTDGYSQMIGVFMKVAGRVLMEYETTGNDLFLEKSEKIVDLCLSDLFVAKNLKK